MKKILTIAFTLALCVFFAGNVNAQTKKVAPGAGKSVPVSKIDSSKPTTTISSAEVFKQIGTIADLEKMINNKQVSAKDKTTLQNILNEAKKFKGDPKAVDVNYNKQYTAAKDLRTLQANLKNANAK